MNNSLSKRKNRKRAVLSVLRKLEQVYDMELAYYLSIPDTQPNEDRQIESGHAVDVLDDVLDSLRGLY